MVTRPARGWLEGVVYLFAGGGDSALDWAIYLSEITKELTLVHRSDSFRGAPDSADKVFKLAQEGKINLVLQSNLSSVHGDEKLEKVGVINKAKEETLIDAAKAKKEELEKERGSTCQTEGIRGRKAAKRRAK